MGSASSAVRPREVAVRPASQGPASTMMAAANPQSRISARSQSSHVGERSSSTHAQSAVTTRPAARVARATMPLRASWRECHPAVADGYVLVLDPGSDTATVLAACRGAGEAALTSARLAGVLDERGQLLRTLQHSGAQVGLLLCATDPEPHRLIGWPVIEIVLHRDSAIYQPHDGPITSNSH